MKKINLIRQNHNDPNMNELNSMREQLEQLIYSDIDFRSNEWERIFREIIHFQADDGSFNLLDSFHIESDCRVHYCFEPTYICTALLIKTLLENKNAFTGKEDFYLPRALHSCCARGLQGHGYDALDGAIKAINYFMLGDVKAFLERYPKMCPEFTDMFQQLIEHFGDRASNQEFSGDWGESYKDSILEIASYFESNTYVFVYGTLMKGQSNHDAYLNEKQFVGEGVIDGYEMYDLGYYPGIIHGKGQVYGEVYCVNHDTVKELDQLEGEGDLYLKKAVIVTLGNGEKLHSIVYVYNRSVSNCPKIIGKYGEEKNSDEYVWYVSYGSNLLSERLKYYIQGGFCCYNERSYRACSDKSLPIESRPVMIPYNMYYSNYDMGSWRKSAVCFLDLSKPGMAYGKAYKIRKSQLEEIHVKEGCGQNWYPDCVQLEDIDGIPAYTYAGYTVKNKEPFCRVSAEYGIVLYRGMKETYPELKEEEILDYLRQCGNKL